MGTSQCKQRRVVTVMISQTSERGRGWEGSGGDYHAYENKIKFAAAWDRRMDVPGQQLSGAHISPRTGGGMVAWHRLPPSASGCRDPPLLPRRIGIHLHR